MATPDPERKEEAQRSPSEMDDKPEQAVESGEPSEVGRRHGQIIDKDGTPTGQEAAEKSRPRRSRPSDEVAPESGRHKWDV